MLFADAVVPLFGQIESQRERVKTIVSMASVLCVCDCTRKNILHGVPLANEAPVVIHNSDV